MNVDGSSCDEGAIKRMGLQVKQEELSPGDLDEAKVLLEVKQEELGCENVNVDEANPQMPAAEALLPGHGPSSVDEALRWAETGVRKLTMGSIEELGEDVLLRLQANLSRVHLSSDFSGMGGMEEAVRHIRLAVSKEAGVPVETLEVKVTHACDIGEAAQSALMSHSGDIAPGCVFTDIVARLPARTKRSLQALSLERDRVAQSAVSNGVALPVARARASCSFLQKAEPCIMTKSLPPFPGTESSL